MFTQSENIEIVNISHELYVSIIRQYFIRPCLITIVTFRVTAEYIIFICFAKPLSWLLNDSYEKVIVSLQHELYMSHFQNISYKLNIWCVTQEAFYNKYNKTFSMCVVIPAYNTLTYFNFLNNSSWVPCTIRRTGTSISSLACHT